MQGRHVSKQYVNDIFLSLCCCCAGATCGGAVGADPTMRLGRR